MLTVGTKGTGQVLATAENSAKRMGSGALDVFATPAMMALIEKTAWESVQDALDAGCGTVGTLLNVAHTAATPLGMTVRCETELTAVEGRKLTFSVVCYDEVGEVGRGTHERFVVQNEKFQAKANAKGKA